MERAAYDTDPSAGRTGIAAVQVQATDREPESNVKMVVEREARIEF